MKQLIIINASPRKGGNSDVIARALEQAAAAAGAAAEQFLLREKQVLPCQGCDVCKKLRRAACVLDDDMGRLLPRISSADALALISPIYYGQITGPAKIFIDRLYCFFNPADPAALMVEKGNKRLAVLHTFGGGPLEEYEKVAEYAARCFAGIGVTDHRAALLGGCNALGACAGDPAFMARVAELGAWLGE